MIQIDSIFFDSKISGTVLLPERDAIPFRNQTTIGTGLQVTQQRSPGFTLTLVRFGYAALLSQEQADVRSKIGTRVEIVEWINQVPLYYSWQTGHRFAVSQARIVDWRVVPAFHGYRLGVKTSLTPALRMISQWTMYAIPI